VGIDLHRRRSVIVRRTPAGETLETVRINNDPVALALELAKAGPDPEVVLEATYGWYWASDVLQANGANVHLAHPLGNNWGHRRVKNDERDATDLVDLLRMGRLAEAWIAPPELRELRELVRYRSKLVALRSGLKAQVHAVLAKEGVAVPMSDLFGVAGQGLLDTCPLGRAYAVRVESLRDLIEMFDREVGMVEGLVNRELAGHPGYRESDTTVRRGHITKQGSRLVRWAAVEAVARQRGGTFIQAHQHRVADRRGRGIGRVAAARKLLTLVYYGLRDGEIRSLAKAG
jgi:transposase